MSQHDQWTGRGTSRVLVNAAALLLLGGAAIHVAVVPEHLEEYLPFGLFFIVVGAVQVALAAAVLLRPSPRLFRAALALSVGLPGLWLLSRTAGLPMGPHPGQLEAIGMPDLICTGFEAATALVLLVLARATTWWPRLGSPLSAAVTSAREGKTGMPRRIIALLGLVLASRLITVAATGHDRVYTVPQVLTGLARDPQAWSGRAATVWGMALPLQPGCSSARWCVSGLYQPHTRRPGPILLLEPGPANPLVVRLRHVPILALVAPQPQWLHWQKPATYRLVFQAVPGITCDGHPCINVVLVDSAPQAQ